MTSLGFASLRAPFGRLRLRVGRLSSRPPSAVLRGLPGAPQSIRRATAREDIRRGPPLDTEMRRLDQLAGLGELVAEVVHEVRNPLGVFRTMLALLPERAGDPEFRLEFARVAGEELARLERLLDALLEQARPADDAPAPTRTRVACDVGEAIASSAALLGHRAAAAGVRIDAAPVAGLPPAAIAPDALRQVLLNLALNALDATPAGGDVRFAARTLGRAVEVCVEDRGPGVPRGARRRVFEPFYTTRAGRPGGLGLAISRRLVEEAGGTISIGDRKGGGSCFRVRVPARSEV